MIQHVRTTRFEIEVVDTGSYPELPGLRGKGVGGLTDDMAAYHAGLEGRHYHGPSTEMTDFAFKRGQRDRSSHFDA